MKTLFLRLFLSLSLGGLAAGCADDKGETGDLDADQDGFLSAQDCDDQDAAVYPAADERCDAVDNDCDGEVDEYAVDQLDWYLDDDGDSYGVPTAIVTSCTQPEGYAAAAWDCDDADAAVLPGGAEVCDGVDNDCDGLTDDADASLATGSATVWRRDADGDGYGDADDEGRVACEDPSTAYDAYVADDTDCDDSSALVAPDQDEVCGDGLDNDCDGEPGDCARAGEMALADADATLFGAGVDHALGAAASGAGDADGDGSGDLWVTTSPADDLRQVSLIRGPLRGSVSVTTASATLLAEARAAYGLALAGGVDLDGDGWPDLVVGDPSATDSLGEEGGGALIYLGPLAGDLPAGIADAGQLGPAGASAGAALALLEDRDEDGTVELLVGAPGLDEGAPDAGGAALINGPYAGEQPLLERAVWLLGGEEGLGAGEAVAAGDLDGDGVLDLIVGAPRADEEAGRAYVWTGALSATTALEDAPVRWSGAAPGDRLGASLAFAGDTDDDGYGDALLAAPSQDGEDGTDHGAAWLLAGGEALAASPAEARASWIGQAGDQLGASLAGAGEISLDDEQDVLIGAPERASGDGLALAFFGPLSGAVALESAGWTVYGAGGGQLGAQVLSLGDLGEDGLPELGFGAPADPRAGAGAGALAIFSPAGW